MKFAQGYLAGAHGGRPALKTQQLKLGLGSSDEPRITFENDDVICCSRVKYRKFFARAFGARIKLT